MCGIVGAVAERNVIPILVEGLKLLEYRGYDSSGLAVIDESGLVRHRALGKIAALQSKIEGLSPAPQASIGLAHTRWATHGKPTEHNAHPHVAGDRVAVVHNGILENYRSLKTTMKHCQFQSETDTEVIAWQLYLSIEQNPDIFSAIRESVKKFKGAFALAILDQKTPNRLFGVRQGSPLVVGLGLGEYFLSSDPHALTPVTQKYISLEDGDIADITKDHLMIYDKDGATVYDSTQTENERELQTSVSRAAVSKGEHRHFMLKEIYEQPTVVIETLQGALLGNEIKAQAFGMQAAYLWEAVKQIKILASGTSYHAGMVAKYWFEDILNIPTDAEIASEFCYRGPVIQNNTLFITLSQSGETADTRTAVELVLGQRDGKKHLPILSICNTPNSTLTRQADMVFITRAGIEIGVASTKAFSAQLVALAAFLVAFGKVQNRIDSKREKMILKGLRQLPNLLIKALEHEPAIAELAQQVAEHNSALFLGRGAMYPIAMEGALKLKEISYIHAEAYAAGELKHGPLALVDETVPVIVVAPHDDLLSKLKSNLQEVTAREGKLIVFEDEQANIREDGVGNVIPVTSGVGRITSPIVFNVPLQLLAYHVALVRGTDIDQPRNLAKSVTVE